MGIYMASCVLNSVHGTAERPLDLDSEELGFGPGSASLYLLSLCLLLCKTKSEFPWCPVVKVLCFQCRTCTGLISGWGTKILHAARHSKKIKKSEVCVCGGERERERERERKEGRRRGKETSNFSFDLNPKASFS